MERQRRTGRFRLEHWQKIRLILIVYDLIAVNLAYGLALWLRFDCRFSSIPKEYLTLWERFIPIYSVFCLVIFGPSGFLIPAMVIIIIVMTVMRKKIEAGGEQDD